MKKLMTIAAAAGLLALSVGARAASPTLTIRLVLKDHRFTPDRVAAPAGQTLRIELVNEDGALEEFDSDDLRVERDVTPHGRTTFEIGPLKPGAYRFIGELHPDTASGVIDVR